MASEWPLDTPQPSVCGSATKRDTPRLPVKAVLSLLAISRAIWLEHRLVGSSRPIWSVATPSAVRTAWKVRVGTVAGRATDSAVPLGSGTCCNRSRWVPSVCRQSRHSDTCACPAFSPLVRAPEADATVRSNMLLPNSSIGVPSW